MDQVIVHVGCMSLKDSQELVCFRFYIILAVSDLFKDEISQSWKPVPLVEPGSNSPRLGLSCPHRGSWFKKKKKPQYSLHNLHVSSRPTMQQRLGLMGLQSLPPSSSSPLLQVGNETSCTQKMYATTHFTHVSILVSVKLSIINVFCMFSLPSCFRCVEDVPPGSGQACPKSALLLLSYSKCHRCPRWVLLTFDFAPCRCMTLRTFSEMPGLFLPTRHWMWDHHFVFFH